ncbi:hypothetical protein DFH08DRAFT_1051456 [Mycena albidolilacea]|uniref:Uncharacterized protein n=1 Tax=Mycena albidolilacea TaxID=1033008 RepID=A0AAD6Z5F4_9AGAR|nr:hypothetical protein DFH08DRAFT_1051456 [Mycena albidolilacea]
MMRCMRVSSPLQLALLGLLHPLCSLQPWEYWYGMQKKKSYCGLTIPNGPRTPRSPRAVLRVPVRAALELWQRRRRTRSRPPRIEVPVKIRLLAPLARTPQQGSPHDREQEEERDTADDTAGDGAGPQKGRGRAKAKVGGREMGGKEEERDQNEPP